MTLLDAPAYDEAGERRRRKILASAAGVLVVLFVGWWLAVGHPVDWPWNWNNYLMGRRTANRFFDAVEKNDLAKAYGIWIHDKNWQQHPSQHSGYSFDRFQQDWSATSPDNEYGAIHSHKIAAATMHGNVLLMAVLINGRKSKALDLDYDPEMHALNFSPPGVKIELGP
jgi:hypothetical protein